ncbi:twin-arginine translocation signal domain-containing protein [Vibrio sinaloensis]|nr:twin-arginine translocation signal domain-containing protein [Vibrio sinaloensis]
MTNITRRGFLKGTGMAAGAMAISSLSPMSLAASHQRGKGVLTAGRMGPMLCEVKDGKLVSTTNAIAQTVVNSLQTTGPDQVHTKARVKYPMVRKGFF